MSAGVEASQAIEDTGFFLLHNAAKLSSDGQNFGVLIIIINLEEPQWQFWHLRMEMMQTTGGNSRGITDEALLGNHR